MLFRSGDNAGAITHIRARNEQGAGYMAEGWARATGEVGVAVVISGPGVTNAATAVGQCYADSLPMLLISAEPPTRTLGKGWGVLHEITEQRGVTEPICAFSATAHCAADIPDLVARAFAVFNSQRPRPVHISLPMDVQAELVEAPLRRVGFGAEIQSQDGLTVSGYWLHRNLFGGAERLRFDAEISDIGAQNSGIDGFVSGLFSRPADLTPDTTLELGFRIEHLDEPTDRKSVV